MALYRVVKGSHYHEHPGVGPDDDRKAESRMVLYTEGEVVSSDADLVKAFPGKFERVEHFQLAAGPGRPVEPRKAEPHGGVEVGPTAGQRGNAELPAVKTKTTGPADEVEDEGQAGEGQAQRAAESPEGNSPLGRDVTEQFPKVKEAGFKVFVNDGGQFQVTRKNNRKKPLNSEPLEDEQVEKFVEDYQSERG